MQSAEQVEVCEVAPSALPSVPCTVKLTAAYAVAVHKADVWFTLPGTCSS